MKRFARLTLFVVAAGAAVLFSGCSATAANEFIYPEYKCKPVCEGKPYMNPKRNTCHDVLPPPGGPWFFERGPVKKPAYK